MPRRQSRNFQDYKRKMGCVPQMWLITDERQGDALLASAQALPPGSAILFRHYATPLGLRRQLFKALRQIADRQGHWLFLADNVATAKRWRADGVHLAAVHNNQMQATRYARSCGLLVSMTAHDDAEMRQANRLADIIFVAPVYATASHPGEATLGEGGFARLAMVARRPVIALGGMTAHRFNGLVDKGADGWAAIDGLTWHGDAD